MDPPALFSVEAKGDAGSKAFHDVMSDEYARAILGEQRPTIAGSGV
jgi:hypothetical protein